MDPLTQQMSKQWSASFFSSEDQRLKHNMTHLWADRYGKGLIQMAWALHGPGLQLIHSKEGDCEKKVKETKACLKTWLEVKQDQRCLLPVKILLTHKFSHDNRQDGWRGCWGQGFVGWCLVQLNQSGLTHYVFLLQCLSRPSWLSRTNTLLNVWSRHDHIWTYFQLAVSFLVFLYHHLCKFSMCFRMQTNYFIWKHFFFFDELSRTG